MPSGSIFVFITDDIVAGREINANCLKQFIEPADLIIAHTAAKYRRFSPSQ